MKNVMVAIRETETRTIYYVAIESDIETGKCLAYNPETGLKVITPYKDRDAFQTNYINKHPYDWMTEFDAKSVKVDPDWMNK